MKADMKEFNQLKEVPTQIFRADITVQVTSFTYYDTLRKV